MSPQLPGRLVLLGHPVTHSVSPRMQDAALRAAGIPLTYSALDVAPDDLEAVVAALRADGAAGNVTIPHKARFSAMCDARTPLAERCGAVNTFSVDESRLIGHNTDVGGFDALLTGLLGGRRSGLRVAVVGAGGAASAVLVALEGWEDATVRLYNRHAHRALALAERVPSIARVADTLAEALDGADVVVNATPVGMLDDRHPVPLESLADDLAVCDLVHRPGETDWVRSARARGHRAAGGATMLVEQGALAFEHWFGTPPDRAAMRAALG